MPDPLFYVAVSNCAVYRMVLPVQILFQLLLQRINFRRCKEFAQSNVETVTNHLNGNEFGILAFAVKNVLNAGKRWYLSEEDELKLMRKGLVKAMERLQRKIQQIDERLSRLASE